MIRHVAVLKFKAGVSAAQIESLRGALLKIRVPGMLSIVCGGDLRLKSANHDFAVVADFDSIAAYHAFDVDEAHNRFRREHSEPLVETAAVAQLEI